jgi:hypothetical protein
MSGEELLSRVAIIASQRTGVERTSNDRLLEGISRDQANIRNDFVTALFAMTAVLFSNWHSPRKKAGLVRARLKVLAM